jgi:hypothetical protein
MLAKLHTFSLLGIDALPVEIEVDVSPGALPKTILVGLPEAAVKESTQFVEMLPGCGVNNDCLVSTSSLHFSNPVPESL